MSLDSPIAKRLDEVEARLGARLDHACEPWLTPLLRAVAALAGAPAPLSDDAIAALDDVDSLRRALRAHSAALDAVRAALAPALTASAGGASGEPAALARFGAAAAAEAPAPAPIQEPIARTDSARGRMDRSDSIRARIARADSVGAAAARARGGLGSAPPAAGRSSAAPGALGRGRNTPRSQRGSREIHPSGDLATHD